MKKRLFFLSIICPLLLAVACQPKEELVSPLPKIAGLHWGGGPKSSFKSLEPFRSVSDDQVCLKIITLRKQNPDQSEMESLYFGKTNPFEQGPFFTELVFKKKGLRQIILVQCFTDETAGNVVLDGVKEELEKQYTKSFSIPNKKRELRDYLISNKKSSAYIAFSYNSNLKRHVLMILINEMK